MAANQAKSMVRVVHSSSVGLRRLCGWVLKTPLICNPATVIQAVKVNAVRITVVRVFVKNTQRAIPIGIITATGAECPKAMVPIMPKEM